MPVQLPDTGICPKCGHMNLTTATECTRCNVALIPAAVAQAKPVWPIYLLGGGAVLTCAFFGLIFALGGRPVARTVEVGPGGVPPAAGGYPSVAVNNSVAPPVAPGAVASAPGAPAAPVLQRPPARQLVRAGVHRYRSRRLR